MSWEARESVHTTAAPAAVWALWADPGRWPEWNENVERAELDGPLALGTTALIKFKRGGTIRFTITELEPERLLVDEARLPGARLGHEHRVEPHAGGAEISNRIYCRGPLSGLYKLMMGRSVRRSVPGIVERERELAEGRRAGRG